MFTVCTIMIALVMISGFSCLLVASPVISLHVSLDAWYLISCLAMLILWLLAAVKVRQIIVSISYAL